MFMDRRIFITYLLICVCALCGARERQERHRYEIRFDTPASLRQQPTWCGGEDPEWESRSLPLGNGSIGANVLGSIQAERITLNEKVSGEAVRELPAGRNIIGTPTRSRPESFLKSAALSRLAITTRRRN